MIRLPALNLSTRDAWADKSVRGSSVEGYKGKETNSRVAAVGLDNVDRTEGSLSESAQDDRRCQAEMHRSRQREEVVEVRVEVIRRHLKGRPLENESSIGAAVQELSSLRVS